jgi:benzoylformate decarboxylase
MAKGKELLMKSLLAEGVRYIFGNPGTTETPLLDTLADYPQLQYILALHEGVAVGMADAYTVATGRVGVVNVHVAPGLGNALGMLFNALEGHSPVLVTAGEPDTRLRLREPLLSHDLVAMAAPLTKWSVRAERADELPLLLHRAFKIAKEPPRGPVFVALPMDVMEAESEFSVLPMATSSTRTPADPAALVEAAGHLLRARNPVVICGSGVYRSGAQEALVAVAEFLGAPVWNTLLTSAVNFPITHPHYRGELVDNHREIRRLLGEPDAVLLVGGHFFREVFYTSGTPWPEESTVIQIDAAPQALARNFPVTVGLAADPRMALDGLLDVLSSRASEEYSVRSAERRSQREQERAEARRLYQAQLRETWDLRPMTPARFFHVLKAILPPGVIIVSEINTGRHDLLRTLSFEKSGDFFGSRGGGIGQGLPGAVGVHLAFPERPILALSGDGSALYSIQALWTAAHYHLPIPFVILNNRAYHIVKRNLDRYHSFFGVGGGQGDRFLDLTDPGIDFVQLAAGFGVPGKRITEPEEVAPAVGQAFASGGPYLLEVLTGHATHQ